MKINKKRVKDKILKQ